MHLALSSFLCKMKLGLMLVVTVPRQIGGGGGRQTD